MKIQAVQDRTFQAKQRFLSLEAKKNMQALLHKMNNETVMDCTETTFSSKMLTGIKINKDSAFYDRRFFCAPSTDLTGFQNWLLERLNFFWIICPEQLKHYTNHFSNAGQA